MLNNSKTQYKVLYRNPKPESINVMESVPKVTAYLILLAIFFGILKLFVFFEVFLGIPIFQFVDASEIILYAPSEIMGSMLQYCMFVSFLYYSRTKNPHHSVVKWSMIFFLVITFAFGYLEISACFNFYPPEFSNMITEGRTIPFISFLLIWSLLYRGKVYISNSIILTFPFFIMFWISIWESSIKSRFLKSAENSKIIRIKSGNGALYKTGGNLKYLGKTAKYWYVFDSKLSIVRVIKDEEVTVSEFSLP